MNIRIHFQSYLFVTEILVCFIHTCARSTRTYLMHTKWEKKLAKLGLFKPPLFFYRYIKMKLVWFFRKLRLNYPSLIIYEINVF